MNLPKFEHPKNRVEYLYQHVRAARHKLTSAGLALGVTLASRTFKRWQERHLTRLTARGETVWIEDLPKPPSAETQRFDELPYIGADLSPRKNLPPSKSNDIVLPSYPEPRYPFAYRKPPLSGMVISGLDEIEKRRPHPLFFEFDYAWGGLTQVFFTLIPPRVARSVMRIFQDNGRRDGAVSREQQPVTDTAAMSAQIKEVAKAQGAALVGITKPRDEWYFEGFESSFKYTISIAVPMDREEMRYTPSERAFTEVFRIYEDVGRVAIHVAEHIRSLGYPARASTNISPGTTEVLHIPLAVEAGLGQLGKHGSIITKDYGSNVRLATVLTDLPLEVDTPVDIGVDDFCMSCQICTTNCPPQAIFETKQMVRGEERWFINFDQCVPYFSANQGCGICIEVCPWSEPGRGNVIMDKMLSRRGSAET